MIVGKHVVNYKYGDTWQLKPIFDVHHGNTSCDKSAFKKYLSESDDRTLFIGGGDLIDAIITHDIKRYRKGQDDTQGESIIDEEIEYMYDALNPYAKQIIGLGEGNHEDVIVKKCGTNPMKRLCDRLTIPYLGYSCLYKLLFRGSNGTGRSVIIRQHHGWGGGSRTRGANITKYERDTGKWDADIYLYGHVHQKQIDRYPRLGLQGKKLIARHQLIVLCGTFLKTYSDNENPTYSEIKGFPPTEIGGVTILIKPNSNAWVDLSATL